MPTTRRKSKLLKYLPKAASAVSFQNPIFSPGREKQRLYSSSGFSGPIVSIIPAEARRRPRKGDDEDGGGLGSTQEPSSPKVSCIGQIKLHKDKKKNKKKKKMMVLNKSASHSHKHSHHHVNKVKRDDDDGGGDDHDHRKKEQAKAKKHDSKFLKIFGFGSRKPNNKSSSAGVAGEFGGPSHSEPMPSLGHMKRFASGRQSLANFDWTAQIAPVNDLDDRNFHSDEEFGRYSDSEGEEEEVIIPFSAPILRGGLQDPRKEVNLWQRRNTASPPPLQIKPIKVRAE